MPKKNTINTFKGFPPKFKMLCYTQTPDIIFDELIKILRHSELVILLLIVRKTFGWKKEFDNISLSQLIEGSGMTKKSVLKSLDALEDYNLITRKQNQQTAKSGKKYFTSTTYSLKFLDNEAENGVGVKSTPTENNSQEGLVENLLLPVGEKNTPTGSSKNDSIQERDFINNKQLQNIKLLLDKLKFNKKNIKTVLDDYELNRLEEVILEYQKNDNKIENPEGWILNALKEEWEFSNPEKQRFEKRKKQEEQAEVISKKENEHEEREQLILNKIEEWINDNPKKYQEILKEEKNRMAERGGITSRSEVLLNLNVNVRIRKDILGLE